MRSPSNDGAHTTSLFDHACHLHGLIFPMCMDSILAHFFEARKLGLLYPFAYWLELVFNVKLELMVVDACLLSRWHVKYHTVSKTNPHACQRKRCMLTYKCRKPWMHTFNPVRTLITSETFVFDRVPHKLGKRTPDSLGKTGNEAICLQLYLQPSSYRRFDYYFWLYLEWYYLTEMRLIQCKSTNHSWILKYYPNLGLCTSSVWYWSTDLYGLSF